MWALAEPRRLDTETRATIESGDTEMDEIARAALDTGFIELPIQWNAAAFVGRLTLLHRDRFDRVLVALFQRVGEFTGPVDPNKFVLVATKLCDRAGDEIRSVRSSGSPI